MESTKYYPNDRRYALRLAEQEEIYNNVPAFIKQFIRGQIKTSYMAAELAIAPDSIERRQYPALKTIMRGEPLTATNYVHKIFRDFICANDEFLQFYKPHPERHLVNLLLRKKIYMSNESIYSFVDSEYETLPILCLYYLQYSSQFNIVGLESISKSCSITYRFKDNLQGFVLSRLLENGRLNLNSTTIKKIYKIIDDIYNVVSPIELINSTIVWTRYGSPADKIEHESYNEYVKLYVPLQL